MIAVRRNQDRHHDRRRKHEVWQTFSSQDPGDALGEGFGDLAGLAENRLGPGADLPRRAQHESEIVTYVREGALAYRDSNGGSGIIQAGEFQRTTAGRGTRHDESNASPTDSAHLFQVSLRPSVADLALGEEHKRFSAAERRGGLCLVASFDARRGSLRLHQDALVFSALLDPGQHVIHALPEGRRAWLHVVEGEVALGDLILTAGDGAGLTAERAVSLTAREAAEILLLDLGERGEQSSRPSKMRGAP